MRDSLLVYCTRQGALSVLGSVCGWVWSTLNDTRYEVRVVYMCTVAQNQNSHSTVVPNRSRWQTWKGRIAATWGNRENEFQTSVSTATLPVRPQWEIYKTSSHVDLQNMIFGAIQYWAQDDVHYARSLCSFTVLVAEQRTSCDILAARTLFTHKVVCVLATRVGRFQYWR